MADDDRAFMAVQALAEEIGSISKRVEAIEKVLKDHVQEANAHDACMIPAKK